MLVYGKYDCIIVQMLYVCVLCASCGRYKCCILHDLKFVNSGQDARGILHCLVFLPYSVSFCLPHHIVVSAFIICNDLCACTEMF